MSGPVTAVDVTPEAARDTAAPAEIEVTESREAVVGALTVRRALPRRTRRTVGAWCFVDHLGPVDVDPDGGPNIGPHPHMGLQTVTWLLAGEVLHHDSLGSEQPIRPGQLNLMTAGHGVAHAEESTGTYRGEVHGVQLWVAQPAATRDGDSAFEHHADLPRVDLANATATVLVGSLADVASTARRDTDHAGADLALRGGETVVPLPVAYEHCFVVLSGAVSVDGHVVEPGHLAYLGTGRDEIALTANDPARVLLLGGVPFPEQVLMWWNFVAREKAEVERAWHDWADAGERFGRVVSKLPRIDVGAPPWVTG